MKSFRLGRVTAGAFAAILVVAPMAAGGAGEGAAGNAGLAKAGDGRACIEQFLAMLNHPTLESVKTFEDRYGSTERGKTASVADRTRVLAAALETRGAVEPERIADTSPEATTVIVHAANGEELAFEFHFSGVEAGKLDAVMISPAAEHFASQPVDRAAIGAVVEAAAKALQEQYVFPDAGAKMAALVRENLAKGAYDSITGEPTLCMRLTNDLRSVTHDKHLGLRVEPSRDEEAKADAPTPAEAIAADNYAFRKVEVLPGNIGYLKFDGFVESEEAKAKAAHAMAFLENCAALIVDLRTNGGGSPEMIRFLTSYLFESRTHLNDMVDRDGKTVEEYWTLDEVPGKRLRPGVPVFVLTSGRTFSGAEEFCYNLKNLKRATIVGETTGGGAHPVMDVRLNDRFVLGVPFMRAQNPISRTNWEGVGVAPDVAVPAPQALDKALELAREAAKNPMAGAK